MSGLHVGGRLLHQWEEPREGFERPRGVARAFPTASPPAVGESLGERTGFISTRSELEFGEQEQRDICRRFWLPGFRFRPQCRCLLPRTGDLRSEREVAERGTARGGITGEEACGRLLQEPGVGFSGERKHQQGARAKPVGQLGGLQLLVEELASPIEHLRVDLNTDRLAAREAIEDIERDVVVGRILRPPPPAAVRFLEVVKPREPPPQDFRQPVRNSLRELELRFFGRRRNHHARQESAHRLFDASVGKLNQVVETVERFSQVLLPAQRHDHRRWMETWREVDRVRVGELAVEVELALTPEGLDREASLDRVCPGLAAHRDDSDDFVRTLVDIDPHSELGGRSTGHAPAITDVARAWLDPVGKLRLLWADRRAGELPLEIDIEGLDAAVVDQGGESEAIA